MLLNFTLAAAVLLSAADSLPRSLGRDTLRAGPRDEPAGIALPAEDTVPRRPRRKSVEISDAYATRLRIHKLASWATVPLIAAQAVVGQRLYVDDAGGGRPPQWAKDLHTPLAFAIGGLFAVNTVTGSINWWESRHQADGRTWRTIHSALMLISDAGFAYTASIGNSSRFSQNDRNVHKAWAIGSSTVALASYVMMLSPIRRD